MEERHISLVTLEAYRGLYLARETEQEQTEWITDRMKRLMNDQLLPISLNSAFDQPAFDLIPNVLLQVCDSSTVLIKGSLPFTVHPDRYLTRLEVVAWGLQRTCKVSILLGFIVFSVCTVDVFTW